MRNGSPQVRQTNGVGFSVAWLAGSGTNTSRATRKRTKFLRRTWLASSPAMSTRPIDIKEELRAFGDTGKPDAEFYEDRLADMAVAYEKNSLQTDRRALLLQISSYLMLAGLLFHLLALYSYLWRTDQ